MAKVGAKTVDQMKAMPMAQLIAAATAPGAGGFGPVLDGKTLIEGPFDPTAPGPMAFADPARVRGILIDAGWSAIEIDPLDTVSRFDLSDDDDGIDGRMALLMESETGRRFCAQVPEPERAPALAAARADVETFLVDGHVELPAACWIVRARR